MMFNKLKSIFSKKSKNIYDSTKALDIDLLNESEFLDVVYNPTILGWHSEEEQYVLFNALTNCCNA